MKRFIMRRLIAVLCTSGLLGVSHQASASAFQIWEQDGASIGSYHAGYAALANDASTAFYNPAGITRIGNQQLIVGADSVMTDFQYKGTVSVNGLGDVPSIVTAQGGTFNLVPFLHYVAPISDTVGFGFDVVVPFGLKTDYGRDTQLRYVATLSSLTVVDITPSLGIKVNDKGSVGFGLDIEKADGEFDNVGAFLDPANDTQSTNRATGTGYGFHLGGLYEFTPDSRVGLSYHSQVVHHLTGSSKFIGPLNVLTDGPLVSDRAQVNITLPPFTALSGYHKITPQVALMGSVIFTQWSTFRQLTFKNDAGLIEGGPPFGLDPSTSIVATIKEAYCNTWNLTVGTEYYLNQDMTLRGGFGYDQSPVQNAFRNVQLPDNDRFVLALGGHYQASKAIGVDLGWSHFFVSQAKVAPPPQVTGAQISTTNGDVTGGADVIGGQITWDM